MDTIIRIILLLMVTSLVQGAQPNELLKVVSANKSAKLSAYNAEWLQEYIINRAVRYRIVKVDTKLLHKDDDFTVTPFDDVEPLLIKQLSVRRNRDSVYWDAHVQQSPEIEALLDKEDIKLFNKISMHAYDLDEDGNASPSFMNRFKFSPHWEIDSAGIPVLEENPKGGVGIAGGPPTTPEEIAHHKKLKKLKKQDFSSVAGQFIDLTSEPRVRFVLEPLKYTPRYSVIAEIDESTTLTKSTEPEFLTRSEFLEHVEKGMERRASEVEPLPMKPSKAVKGDVE